MYNVKSDIGLTYPSTAISQGNNNSKKLKLKNKKNIELLNIIYSPERVTLDRGTEENDD